MNRLARILTGVAGLVLAVAAPAHARERIVAFESRVVIATDGELTVTETITVDAEGDKIKRGIYRDFPTRYEGRDGRPHRVGFEVLEVRR
ncbi:MAG: DUF2207 domain-containing protein, partial [Alphaproteobacteria bacterium]|nr:DUF2207 domain-containing protein [Alphaproteobacteria bacterium]